MGKQKILIVNAAQDGRNTYFAEPILSLLHRTEPKIVSFHTILTIEDTLGYDAIIISGQPPDNESHTRESVDKQ